MTSLDRVIRDMVNTQASVARRVRRLETADTPLNVGWVNIREFGGDAASAAAYAIASQRALYFPYGAYDLSDLASPILVDGNLHMIGDGIGTSILQGGATKDLFDVRGGGLTCEGLEFDTWDDVVLCTNTTAHIPHLRFFNCRFDSVDNGIIWYDETSVYDLNELRVQGCEFVSVTTDGLLLFIPDIDRVWITDNYFKDVGYRGVWLGAGNDGDTTEYAHICNNHFDTMGESDGRTEVHAIIAFRQYLDISHNTINTILSGAADDWEAIYCKTRYSNISHNIIQDGGKTCIMLKGVGRGDGAPGGGIVEEYAVTVDHNTIIGGYDGIGFGAGADDHLIESNWLEAQTHRAISAAAGDHHKIHNNMCRLGTGQAAIGIGGGSSNITDLVISNNTIDGQTYASPTAVGILFTDGAITISGVKILNNTIRDVDASTATGFGIDFQLGQNIDFVEMAGNILEDLDYGVRFDAAQQVAADMSANIFRSVTTPVTNWASVTTRIAKGNIGWNPPAITFADGDTTPSVANSAVWYVASQTLATIITTFNDGLIGDTITVKFNDTNTTLDHGANLLLYNSVDYNPPAATWMTFIRETATRWRELSRSEP